MELQSEQIDEGVKLFYKTYEEEDGRLGTLLPLRELIEKRPALVYASEKKSGRLFNIGYVLFYIGSEEFLRRTDSNGLGFDKAQQGLYAIIGADSLEAKTSLEV